MLCRFPGVVVIIFTCACLSLVVVVFMDVCLPLWYQQQYLCVYAYHSGISSSIYVCIAVSGSSSIYMCMSTTQVLAVVFTCVCLPLWYQQQYLRVHVYHSGVSCSIYVGMSVSFPQEIERRRAFRRQRALQRREEEVSKQVNKQATYLIINGLSLSLPSGHDVMSQEECFPFNLLMSRNILLAFRLFIHSSLEQMPRNEHFWLAKPLQETIL